MAWDVHVLFIESLIFLFFFHFFHIFNLDFFCIVVRGS